MTKKNNTKRSLLMSVLVLILCFAMLIGGTFAWFSDNTVTDGNKIQAGTLDVDLLMADPTSGNYTSIDKKTAAIFGADSLTAQNNPMATLWEPGKTQIVYLAVDNEESTLDLKYSIALEVEDGGLIGALEYAVVDGAKFGDITATSWEDIKAIADVQTGDVAAGTLVVAPNGAIKANEDMEYFALAIHMKETAGNEYQGKNITVDVTVFASQLTSESDVFGDTYDEAANDLYVINEATGTKYIATSLKGLSAAAEIATADTSITSVTYMTAEGAVEAPVVRDAAALKAAIDAVEEVVVLTKGDFMELNMESIAGRDTLTIVGAGAETVLQFKTNVVLSKFNELTISNCSFVKRTGTKWGLLVFSSSAQNGVYTISDCVFNSDGDQCIYINQDKAATYNIENCVFNAKDKEHDGVITIQNNPVDYTVNVIGCEFNTNNREIYIAENGKLTEVYEGWTLNAPGVPVYTWEPTP